MFYVLEGTLTLRLGDREIEAGPGSFACVPPGVVHTFRNDSDDPVRMLNFNTPAGWENYTRIHRSSWLGRVKRGSAVSEAGFGVGLGV